MSKKIIIIGAGIAGLSTGCYGQMKGFDTEIFEMHNIPGGLCTAWSRNGYTFDGCIQWLMGTRPGTSFYKYWNEIGALDGMKFFSHDLHLQVEDPKTGMNFALCSDIDKLEKQLLEISPRDEAVIRELTYTARKFKEMKMPMDKPQDMYSLWDIAKLIAGMLPKGGYFKKLTKTSIGDLAERFKDNFLRESLPGVIERDYILLVFVMILATYANGDAGWPMGGSLKFAKNIEKSYLKKGGKINYNARVLSIMIEGGKAVGVRLEDGTEHRADYVVSAVDGYTTIFKMLGGRYIDEKIKTLYTKLPLAPTTVQVSLGVDCDLSKEPCSICMKLENPLTVGNVKNNYISFKHYCYDPSMAPAGKSAVTSLLYSDYEYWEKLYEDKEAYKAQKRAIADETIKAFEKRFPYAKGKIEVVDVSTPYTYTRYTGTWKGVYMSWLTTKENSTMTVPAKLPGLDRFYMAGQWANPSGGVPVGAITGRWCIMRICREEGKRF